MNTLVGWDQTDKRAKKISRMTSAKAVFFRDVDMVQYLLEKGASVNALNLDRSATEILTLCFVQRFFLWDSRCSCCDCFLSNCLSDARSGMTPLHVAAKLPGFVSECFPLVFWGVFGLCCALLRSFRCLRFLT